MSIHLAEGEKTEQIVIVEEYIGKDITNRYMVDMKFDVDEEIELYDPELEKEENTNCIFMAARDKDKLYKLIYYTRG